MRRTFRPGEVCQLAQITASQLEHLVGLGIIVPLQPAPTPGSFRLYSVANVFEAALAGELADAGIAGQRLRDIFAALRASLATVPVPMRPLATFVQYVRAVTAMATILGQTDDPVHAAWLREVDAVLGKARKTGKPLDARILRLLAAKRTSGEQPEDGR